MRDEPIINPADTKLYLAGVRKVPPENLRLPELLLITYGKHEFDCARGLIEGRMVEWWAYKDRLAVGQINGREIAVSHSFIGAPGAVMMLEELISHGVKKIIEAGIAGGMGAAVHPGDLCVVTQALSDEGTSRHYYPRRRAFTPSPRLTLLLDRSCRDTDLPIKTVAVWTTDAPYRETRSKVEKFSRRGAALVNMETSSIFAIAKFRKVDAASIQVVSDILLHGGWKPAFRVERVLENRQAMLRIAIQALARA